jgi:hypothetical protein
MKPHLEHADFSGTSLHGDITSEPFATLRHPAVTFNLSGNTDMLIAAETACSASPNGTRNITAGAVTMLLSTGATNGPDCIDLAADAVMAPMHPFCHNGSTQLQLYPDAAAGTVLIISGTGDVEHGAARFPSFGNATWLVRRRTTAAGKAGDIIFQQTFNAAMAPILHENGQFSHDKLFRASISNVASTDPIDHVLRIDDLGKTLMTLTVGECTTATIAQPMCRLGQGQSTFLRLHAFNNRTVLSSRSMAVGQDPSERNCTFPQALVLLGNGDVFPSHQFAAAVQRCSADGNVPDGVMPACKVVRMAGRPVMQCGASTQMSQSWFTPEWCAGGWPAVPVCSGLRAPLTGGQGDIELFGVRGIARTLVWQGCGGPAGSGIRSGFESLARSFPLSDVVGSAAAHSEAVGAHALDHADDRACLLRRAAPGAPPDCASAIGQVAAQYLSSTLQGYDLQAYFTTLTTFGGAGGNATACAPSGAATPALLRQLLADFRGLPFGALRVSVVCRPSRLWLVYRGVPVYALRQRGCYKGTHRQFACSSCLPYITPTTSALPYALLAISSVKDIFFMLFGLWVLKLRRVRRFAARRLAGAVVRTLPYKRHNGEAQRWAAEWAARFDARRITEDDVRASFAALIALRYLSPRAKQVATRERGAAASAATSPTEADDASRRLLDDVNVGRGGPPDGASGSVNQAYSLDTINGAVLSKGNTSGLSSVDAGDDVYQAVVSRELSMDASPASGEWIAVDDVFEIDDPRFLIYRHRMLLSGALAVNTGDAKLQALFRRAVECWAQHGIAALAAGERGEGADEARAWQAFVGHADLEHVILRTDEVDRKFTPQLWMLSLELAYAVVLLTVCVLGGDHSVEGRFRSYEAKYFGFVNSCTSVGFVTNAALRVWYNRDRGTGNALSHGFLAASLLLLLPAVVTHIIPGMVLFAWLPIGTALGFAAVAFAVARTKARGLQCDCIGLHREVLEAYEPKARVALNIVFRLSATFAVALVLQTLFNYMVLFYDRERMQLGYWGIVAYERDSRQWLCLVEYLWHDVGQTMRFMSAFF